MRDFVERADHRAEAIKIPEVVEVPELINNLK